MFQKKFNLKTWDLGLVLLLSVFLPVCSVIALTSHAVEHNSPEDFWPVSMMPVKVTEITKEAIYYEFQGKRSITLGSFAVEERTIYPKNFREGKIYYVTFCPTHKVAYAIDEISP